MAHSTSQTAFITVEKSMPYRGAREHWSNAYHFDLTPSSTAQWEALAAACMALEQPGFDSSVQFEAFYGHAPGTPPVLMYEYDVPPAGEGGAAGTYAPGTGDYSAPGDSACWVRYSTTQKNTLGKPIYLRNYYHGVYWNGLHDTWAPSQRTHFDTLGYQMVLGVSAAGTTFRRAGPRGAVAQGHTVGTFITTRTLKHRGRRHRWSPSSAPTGYKWILTNVPQEIN